MPNEETLKKIPDDGFTSAARELDAPDIDTSRLAFTQRACRVSHAQRHPQRAPEIAARPAWQHAEFRVRVLRAKCR